MYGTAWYFGSAGVAPFFRVGVTWGGGCNYQNYCFGGAVIPVSITAISTLTAI